MSLDHISASGTCYVPSVLRCLMNIFLMHSSVFEVFSKLSNVMTQCPKSVCRILENAAKSVRMCIAVSSSFLSPQNSHLGSSANFDLNACFLRLWPVRTLMIMAVFSLSP